MFVTPIQNFYETTITNNFQKIAFTSSGSELIVYSYNKEAIFNGDYFVTRYLIFVK